MQRWLKIGLVGISFLGWGPGVSQSEGGALRFTQSDEQGIRLLVSLLWEGDTIDEANLQAIEAFRKEYPNIKFQQFLNPAYYFKEGANQAQLTAQMRRVVRAGDVVGLHLHSWKSLLAASSVSYRDAPSFWGINEHDCRNDCGHDVPLSAYSPEELDLIFAKSLSTLRAHGFIAIDSFSAGGWMGSPEVLSAAYRHGLRYDSSAVAPSQIKAKLSKYPLGKWLENLWGQERSSTQPHFVSVDSGRLTEIPFNVGTLDYVTSDEVLNEFVAYCARWRQQPNRELVFHLGFYQETAVKQLGRMRIILNKIFDFAYKSRTPINLQYLNQSIAVHDHEGETF